MVQIRWLGAAGLEITNKDKTYLIDPYITRVNLLPVLSGRRITPDRKKILQYIHQLPGELQAVMVGHTHLDHALDVPLISEIKPEAVIIGSESLAALMDVSGIENRVMVCNSRSNFNLPGGARATYIPSLHGRNILGNPVFPGDISKDINTPLKTSDFRHGMLFDILIETGGIKFLHIGSANLEDRELADIQCDVLFVCVPGWRRISNYQRRLIFSVKPSVVVPFHFDNFFTALRHDGTASNLPFLMMKMFLNEIKKCDPEIKIIIPVVNRTISF